MTPNIFTGNTWVHVVTTVDAVNKYIRQYVNGTLVTEVYAPSIGQLPALAGNASISNINNDNAGTYLWSGGLDDVRVYNRVLSGYEVRDLYILTNQYTTLLLWRLIP